MHDDNKVKTNSGLLRLALLVGKIVLVKGWKPVINYITIYHKDSSSTKINHLASWHHFLIKRRSRRLIDVNITDILICLNSIEVYNFAPKS